MHVLRNARSRMKSNRSPDGIKILLRDSMRLEKATSRICSIDFETVRRAAVARHQADVVEHRAGVEEFAIEVKTALLAGDCSKVVDTAGVVEEQLRFRVPNELCDLPRQLCVGDTDAANRRHGSKSRIGSIHFISPVSVLTGLRVAMRRTSLHDADPSISDMAQPFVCLGANPSCHENLESTENRRL